MKKLDPSSFKFAFTLLLIVFLSPTFAQNYPGKRDSINSEILKENRKIQVVLPKNYKPESGEKYEVLYVLDGEWNVEFISTIQDFTLQEGYMPPVIIVAIFNTDRNRDFLPTNSPMAPTSGGADKFLSFFKNELIPYITKTYPVNGDNMLYGHSFGGVFSMYALLYEPQLFNAYIAVDPSFWWDNGAMNKLATEKFSQPLPASKLLFITGREGGLEGMGIPGMDSVLKSKAPKELNWKIAAYPNETHGSVKLKSIYDGLKFIYDGYTSQAIEFHPMNGIVLKDVPYTIYYFGSSPSVHYTTDGSQPTPSSATMKSENTLTNSATVLAKSFGNYHRSNKITHGEFKVGKPLAATTKPKAAKAGGLTYSYYEGEWDKLPDFGKLKPVHSGLTSKDFNVNKLPHQVNFACLIEGYIEIQKEGHYIFVLDSDDGSKFYLGNTLLLDHDGLHAEGSAKTFIVPLTKGFYPIRVEYFQKGGGASLGLMYVIPGQPPSPTPIPFEVQYSKK